jgi:Ni2+-binding GTPase involved in maturation of urease and hydrogenase
MPGKMEMSSNQVQLRALCHEEAFIVCLAVSPLQKPLNDVELFLLMVSGGEMEQIRPFELVHGIVDV